MLWGQLLQVTHAQRTAFIWRRTKAGQTRRCRWRQINLVELNRRHGGGARRDRQAATLYTVLCRPLGNVRFNSHREILGRRQQPDACLPGRARAPSRGRFVGFSRSRGLTDRSARRSSMKGVWFIANPRPARLTMLRLTTSQVAADSRSHDINIAGKRNHRVSGLVCAREGVLSAGCKSLSELATTP